MTTWTKDTAFAIGYRDGDKARRAMNRHNARSQKLGGNRRYPAHYRLSIMEAMKRHPNMTANDADIYLNGFDDGVVGDDWRLRGAPYPLVVQSSKPPINQPYRHYFLGVGGTGW